MAATGSSLSYPLFSSPPRGALSVVPVSARFGSRVVVGNTGLSKRARRMTSFCSLDAPKADNPIELKYASFPTVMDIDKVRDILPHRVIEYNPGVSAVTIKNVKINDSFFPGHFPERPIMPGVLIVERHWLNSRPTSSRLSSDLIDCITVLAL